MSANAVCRKFRGTTADLVAITTKERLELCVYCILVELSHGFEHCLVTTDHFTKFASVIPTRNENAKTTAKTLYDNILNLYGYPWHLHSVQGKQLSQRLYRSSIHVSWWESRNLAQHLAIPGVMVHESVSINHSLIPWVHFTKHHWKDDINSLLHARCMRKQATRVMSFCSGALLVLDHDFGIDARITVSTSLIFRIRLLPPKAWPIPRFLSDTTLSSDE